MLRILLIGGVLTALLAYALYEPLPDYVQDRAMLTSITVVSSALRGIGQLAHRIGLVSSPEAVMQSAVVRLTPSLQNSSSVQLTYQQFAGSRTLVVKPTTQAASNDNKDGRAAAAAAVIYIHGGGWVFGAPEMSAQVMVELVERTGVTVYAIRYRLAPEHIFPAAFDDCLAATEAIFESAKSSGVDPSRIAIAGDSAGGQLAASVVQQLRRAGSRYKPKVQVLVYPITQVVNVRTKSYLNWHNEPILKSAHMHNFISLYLTGSKAAVPWLFRHGHVTDEMRSVYEKATESQLPTAVEGSGTSYDVSDSVASRLVSLATDFRVSPLLGDQLEKLVLPPTHILACEFDPLFEDSVMYAKRLERSGVRTHLRIFRSFHGSLGMPADGGKIRDYLVQVFGDEL